MSIGYFFLQNQGNSRLGLMGKVDLPGVGICEWFERLFSLASFFSRWVRFSRVALVKEERWKKKKWINKNRKSRGQTRLRFLSGLRVFWWPINVGRPTQARKRLLTTPDIVNHTTRDRTTFRKSPWETWEKSRKLKKVYFNSWPFLPPIATRWRSIKIPTSKSASLRSIYPRTGKKSDF